MLWSLCSSKGGAGVSVLSAAFALELARDRPVTLVDLCGDLGWILGVDNPRHGVLDWLSSDAAGDALDRISIEVTGSLRLVPRGEARCDAVSVERVVAMTQWLRGSGIAVIDVGVVPDDAGALGAIVCAAADRRTLVTRPCFLALKRAQALGVAVDDVIEVREPGRPLTALDIEVTLGVPVSASVTTDPSVARAVDAGLLTHRVPRSLRRVVRTLARRQVEAGVVA